MSSVIRRRPPASKLLPSATRPSASVARRRNTAPSRRTCRRSSPRHVPSACSRCPSLQYCSALDVQGEGLCSFPPGGGRGHVKLCPLRRRRRGERGALNEAALRRRSRARVGMGGEGFGGEVFAGDRKSDHTTEDREGCRCWYTVYKRL